jgi:hypothetical protein
MRFSNPYIYGTLWNYKGTLFGLNKFTLHCDDDLSGTEAKKDKITLLFSLSFPALKG